MCPKRLKFASSIAENSTASSDRDPATRVTVSSTALVFRFKFAYFALVKSIHVRRHTSALSRRPPGGTVTGARPRPLHLRRIYVEHFPQTRRNLIVKPGLTPFQGTKGRSRHASRCGQLRLSKAPQHTKVRKEALLGRNVHQYRDLNTENLCSFREAVDMRCYATRLPRLDCTRACPNEPPEFPPRKADTTPLRNEPLRIEPPEWPFHFNTKRPISAAPMYGNIARGDTTRHKVAEDLIGISNRYKLTWTLSSNQCCCRMQRRGIYQLLVHLHGGLPATSSLCNQ